VGHIGCFHNLAIVNTAVKAPFLSLLKYTNLQQLKEFKTIFTGIEKLLPASS
jgi:hypothetical protein